MTQHLIAEYNPPQKSRFLLRSIKAVFLGMLAFVLYRFFVAGSFAGAEWILYPALLAMWVGFLTSTYVLKASPQVKLYQNGLAIDESFFSWPEIQTVRYRRFENFWNHLECEWRIQANDRHYRFSVIEPNVYIDRFQLNSAFVNHVKDFRDESRLI